MPYVTYMSVFKNRVRGKDFAPKSEEVAGGDCDDFYDFSSNVSVIK